MSRKYSSWASNQSSVNTDLPMMRLTTVTGNEQDQLRNAERVEALPHMYINVDAPPAPMTRIDTRAIQPIMISRQNSSYFAAPTVIPPPINGQTKLWPLEKSVKDSSVFESASSTSKRPHKQKHHHHHHHGDKHRHHHHRHHSRRHRAKSAESIRNRQHQTLLSPSKFTINNPQYIEQDQQQQQQQPMIVYREVPNGEGYTVDPNGLASVPYGTENEGTFVDDQQAPLFVYRDANGQQQPIVTDGIPQQVFYNQDQEANIGRQSAPLQSIENKLISHRIAPVNETQVGNYPPFICTQSPAIMNPNPSVNAGCIQEIERIYIEDDCCPAPRTSCIIQQSDPHVCLSHQQQQPSQIFYCADSNQQEYLCNSNSGNFVQQTILPQQQQQQQQQFVCLDNTQTTIQPTMINQIPVFNGLNTTNQSVLSVPQTSLQRTTSVIMQQPQMQPLQILQQPQPVQIIQQPQPLQIMQQPQIQPLQIMQQPQQFQIIQNPQTQPGQFVQFAQAAPQVLQTMQPQIIQSSPMLQTLQMPGQTVAANPQILYQRPYDPVLVPIQNQQMAIANTPLVALSQPSYAPSRMMSAAPVAQPQGANMFRQALIRTVADRAGVSAPSASAGFGGLQLMQSGIAGAAVSNPNFLIAGGLQRSASLPIVPLTPGGLLIPFQPSQTQGLRRGLIPQAGGYPSALKNFSDIQQQIQQRRALANLQQQNYSRVPSPPVLSPARNQAPYAGGNLFSSGVRSGGGTPFPSLSPGSYARPAPTGLAYSQPSFAGSSGGSVMSNPSAPYRSFIP